MLYAAGGSADVLELRTGDEIVAVDGADVANHYLESVQSVINQAVTVGQLQLRIRRTLTHSQSAHFIIIIIIITSIFLKWPKQQTPPQGPLQNQSSKQAGSDSVVVATKQISL